jgi:hypothetical protein
MGTALGRWRIMAINFRRGLKRIFLVLSGVWLAIILIPLGLMMSQGKYTLHDFVWGAGDYTIPGWVGAFGPIIAAWIVLMLASWIFAGFSSPSSK